MYAMLNFRLVFGMWLMAVALAVGLYVGVWWGFVGGVREAWDGMGQHNGLLFAIGLARVFFCVPLGCVCGLLLFVPGNKMAEAAQKEKDKCRTQST